jgi:biopolymer transport protein TolR
MAFGRLERTRASRPFSDINMTPLIDVMLVLMVLFMLAAPLIASSLKLDLPASDAATASNTDAPDILSVAVDAKGQLFLGDEPVTRQAFDARVADAARMNLQTEVQLRADRTVPYGTVAELIGAVQKAGLTKIGLVTDPQQPSR